MAKISKPMLKKHYEALELLKKDKLTYDDKIFVYENFHEGVSKANNLISAHFTPLSLARNINICVRHNNWVDIGAGIGMLSYCITRDSYLNFKEYIGICVERDKEYYEIGKKLLPELHWINGDIFDQKVIDEIKSLMKGKDFSIVSNPPYGKQVKGFNENMNYQKGIFEYKAIEIGAMLGAEDGVFLIPQTSCPFRMTNNRGNVYDEAYKTSEYKKFVEQTGLEITANIGIHTNIPDDEKGWKDVNIVTEFAIVEYNELEYKSKVKQSQITLF